MTEIGLSFGLSHVSRHHNRHRKGEISTLSIPNDHIKQGHQLTLKALPCPPLYEVRRVLTGRLGVRLGWLVRPSTFAAAWPVRPAISPAITSRLTVLVLAQLAVLSWASPGPARVADAILAPPNRPGKAWVARLRGGLTSPQLNGLACVRHSRVRFAWNPLCRAQSILWTGTRKRSSGRFWRKAGVFSLVHAV